MQLGRYQVSTLRPPPILSVDFSLDGRFFAVALETGYEVWRTFPLGLIRRRGTLVRAVPLPNSPMIALQGGGKSPLYSPNKVILYHDGLGVAVAELEFGETARGIACRASILVIALSRRIIAFQYGSSATATPVQSVKGKARADQGSGGFAVVKLGEWETVKNDRGLIAIASAPNATLLAIPGRQQGHVQLINLPPCRSSKQEGPSRTDRSSLQSFRSPIILAHEHELSSLACTASGSHIVTTSERGTLLRVWNTHHGRLERELRRGVDRAEMWGVQFEDAIFARADAREMSGDERRREEQRSKGGRVVGWSDKGTVHVWGVDGDESHQSASKGSATQAAALASMLSKNLPLPKYFSSAPSTALYRLPRKNPHAFASTVSAAAEAAWLPSMKMREAGEEDGEWNERFVVGWVAVEVEVEVEQAVDEDAPIRPGQMGRKAGGASTAPQRTVRPEMGNRLDRRSFGSSETATPRTSTPTASASARGRDTPRLSSLPRLDRTASGTSTSRPSSRLHSHADVPTTRRQSTEKRTTTTTGKSSFPTEKIDNVKKQTQLERQLVAITFGGDWYRLRIPDEVEVDEDGAVQKRTGRKCELVEYRRLNVGGGGW